MFWFLFDRHFHAKQLPIWWMGLSQFPGSLSPLMTSRSYTCRVTNLFSWTHLRLRQWPCSRLCWCPACKEALVSGKWFAHWQCTLCWQRPIAFTLWWINPVDRLTCSSLRRIANQYSQTVALQSTGHNVRLISFHSGRSPKFSIMSENRALY